MAALVCFVLCAAPLRAQDTIAIDVDRPLADAAAKRVGINVNFLLDDDGNRPRAMRSLADALRAAGVKYLRYPGGEKSDAYLWSVPPYATSLPTLARWATGEWPQNQEWPSYDRALVESDGHTWKTNPLSFDEFMDVCRAIDCIPTLVVCYDSMYKPPQPGGVAPTRAQLIETAREWVRYANLVKGYGVKYWEIGNESFQNHYNGGTTADVYASDLVDFSRAMKAIDPTIHIGANGQSWDWWQQVLTTASADIDFLAVHNYPAYGWQSYDDYAGAAVPDLSSVVRVARDAIATFAPLADRTRLTIAVSEVGAASWSGVWPDLNDLGHALVFSDILSEQLRDPLIEFSELWTTRWSGNDTAPVPVLWDALNKDNELQATGNVLALWSGVLAGNFVAVNSAAGITGDATFDAGTGILRVLLANRGMAVRPVTLTGVLASSDVHVTVFGGTTAADTNPVVSDRGAIDSSSTALALTLDPLSITRLEFVPRPMRAGHQIPGRIEAEDFDADGFWDSTAENVGGSYRATPVDIEPTADGGGGFNVGWIDAGEWLQYTVTAPQTASFTFAARVASPVDWARFDLVVDGQVVQHGLAVPNTGWWQTWATLQAPVTLTAGTHTVRLATSTGWFNVNWIDLQLGPAVPADVPIPGHIEAEDFDAFWDRTPENAGGEYRDTAVDIERTADEGGGYNVGWIEAGEWLEYTVDVAAPGTYRFSVRVASPVSDATLDLSVDGTPVFAPLAVPNTGWWQNWQTVTTRAVDLTAGRHRLRLSTVTGWLNINWIQWSP